MKIGMFGFQRDRGKPPLATGPISPRLVAAMQANFAPRRGFCRVARRNWEGAPNVGHHVSCRRRRAPHDLCRAGPGQRHIPGLGQAARPASCVGQADRERRRRRGDCPSAGRPMTARTETGAGDAVVGGAHALSPKRVYVLIAVSQHGHWRSSASSPKTEQNQHVICQVSRHAIAVSPKR